MISVLNLPNYGNRGCKLAMAGNLHAWHLLCVFFMHLFLLNKQASKLVNK